jgi:hypothetical protein
LPETYQLDHLLSADKAKGENATGGQESNLNKSYVEPAGNK